MTTAQEFFYEINVKLKLINVQCVFPSLDDERAFNAKSLRTALKKLNKFLKSSNLVRQTVDIIGRGNFSPNDFLKYACATALIMADYAGHSGHNLSESSPHHVEECSHCQQYVYKIVLFAGYWLQAENPKPYAKNIFKNCAF